MYVLFSPLFYIDSVSSQMLSNTTSIISVGIFKKKTAADEAGAARNSLNVLSLTASPVHSVFTCGPGLDRSAAQPFELQSAEAEHMIKDSQNLRTHHE